MSLSSQSEARTGECWPMRGEQRARTGARCDTLTRALIETSRKIIITEGTLFLKQPVKWRLWDGERYYIYVSTEMYSKKQEGPVGKGLSSLSVERAGELWNKQRSKIMTSYKSGIVTIINIISGLIYVPVRIAIFSF